jgi:hypothetical protein
MCEGSPQMTGGFPWVSSTFEGVIEDSLFGITRHGDKGVLPHLISGQFIEHCKPSILQRIQPSSILHFSRDIRCIRS